MKVMINLLVAIIILASACQNKRPQRTLPVLNRFTVNEGDTIYEQIPSFTFFNQDSVPFSSEQLKGKIYVVDFFFTSCPGICPVLTGQMKRLQELCNEIPDLMLVSFTVDPHRDTPSKLKQYGIHYRADFSNWVFLTGPMDSIYHIGKQGYYLGMAKDDNEPGGYMHSGKFVLVDKQGLIRGYYDGTNANDVDRLVKDIRILRTEYNEQ